MLTGLHSWSSQKRRQSTVKLTQGTSSFSPPASLTRRLQGPDPSFSLSPRLGTTWASKATSTSPPLADPSMRPTCPTETPALVLLVRSRLPSRRSGLVIGPSISQRVSSRSLLSLREYCHDDIDLKRAR